MSNQSSTPCAELRRLVTEYLEEVMTGEERTWFEGHLEECGSCEVHLREVKAFVSTLARIGPEPISDGRRAELHGLFKQWRAEIEKR